MTILSRAEDALKQLNALVLRNGNSAANQKALAVAKEDLRVIESEATQVPPTPEPSPPVKEPTDLEKLIPAGFTRVRYDDCTDPEPRNLYGEGLPYDYTAVSRIGKGTFEGAPARTCTVLEGDHAWNLNAFRTELGHDEKRDGLASPTNHEGTFWLYEEGDHTVTVARRELPPNFKLTSGEFQTVFQIKQTNPGSENLTGNEVGPALEIEIRNGRWILGNFWKELWSCPAHAGVPTTFVVETVHSREASKGSVKLTVLENGKQVAQSPTFTSANLSKIAGNPGHYRGGLYMSLKATPVPVTVVHGATEIWK